MKSTPKSLEKIRPRLLLVATVGAVVAIALGFIAHDFSLAAYRFVVFACLAPALGSMLFALIHRLTGGEWGVVFLPFLAAGALLAPWIWLLVLPLLFLHAAPAEAWPRYGSEGMLAIRGLIYAVILFALARPLSRRETQSGAWVGPLGFIVLVFTLHLLSEDWLSSLDPGWHSTAFPLVWMTGMCVSGFACALIAALASGASPRSELPEPRTLGIDWGNLLLSAMLFWCYVTFAQFLIIWAGNLPAEISWFQLRLRGGWAIVPPLLALIHFLLPMAVLLSRKFKLSKTMLGSVAATLVVGQIIYAAWLILPAFPSVGPVALLIALALLIAGAALFMNIYLGAALRRLGTRR